MSSDPSGIYIRDSHPLGDKAHTGIPRYRYILQTSNIPSYITELGHGTYVPIHYLDGINFYSAKGRGSVGAAGRRVRLVLGFKEGLVIVRFGGLGLELDRL